VLSAALGGRDGLVRSVVVTVSREVSLAVSPRPQIDAAGTTPDTAASPPSARARCS